MVKTRSTSNPTACSSFPTNRSTLPLFSSSRITFTRGGFGCSDKQFCRLSSSAPNPLCGGTSTAERGRALPPPRLLPAVDGRPLCRIAHSAPSSSRYHLAVASSQSLISSCRENTVTTPPTRKSRASRYVGALVLAPAVTPGSPSPRGSFMRFSSAGKGSRPLLGWLTSSTSTVSSARKKCSTKGRFSTTPSGDLSSHPQ
mmetsp:Transcript_58836/g.120382  ORF Transcript_58836/g.120382 Transcript_58836/m.120382 type:complete len:200 (-) Transcript_58836:384-983(-)